MVDLEPDPDPARRVGQTAWDAFMVALALVSMGLLVAYELLDLPAEQARNLLWADLAIVTVFWGEFGVRWARADDRRRFVKSNWYELPGMVPIFPGMEGMAGVRVLRLLRVLRILRLVGALRRFEPMANFFAAFAQRSRMGKIVALSLVVLATCALVVWVLEPTTFPSYWDALWWAFVTSTTVGYGDFSPLSSWGRAVAVVLMILGIGLIGTLAGTLSSFLIERGDSRTAHAAESEPGADGDIVEGLERLARLRERGHLTPPEFEAAKRRLLEPTPKS